MKAELRGVRTILGLSNISFGLNPAARQVLNSVFLHEAAEAGLDAAIVHASKILPLHRIDDESRQVCLDLIYDRRRDDYDPLAELLRLFEGATTSANDGPSLDDLPLNERLKRRIIDGARVGLEEDLDEAMAEGAAPLDIVNDILLDGMRVVGDLFASGEMQLPFVLQSAETMKSAVSHLEPLMEKSDQGGRGRVVLATVKGDVHDIGKNLVDIILTNNGYEVINLGIKVGVNEMLSAVEEHQADALGMSGLLVKSTLIMRENLEIMNERSLSTVPVLLGGAALTRTYVERDLREVYAGRLFYGKDAFEGLRVLDQLGEMRRGGTDDPNFGREISQKRVQRRFREAPAPDAALPRRSPEVESDNPLFAPPFLGTRVAKGMSLDEIAEYLNLTALFRNQWGYRPEGGEDDAAFKERVSATLREQLSIAKAEDLLVPQVVWGHFAVASDGNELIVYADDARDDELDALRLPPPGRGAAPLHRRLLSPTREPRPRLRELHAGHHGCEDLGAHAPALQRESLHRLPHAARPRRRDGRGARRAVAPTHPRGAGLRRRGRPHPHGALSPAVPGRPLLVGLPRLSRPHRQRQGRRTARVRAHRRLGLRGVPAAPRADDRRDHLPPPQGQVLRRVTR